jgi:tRNA pseudouridine38-40 synthase
LYRIINYRTNSTFDDGRAWWISNKIELDLDKAIQESQKLIGHHDFSSFRDSSCQAPSPLKTIDNVEPILVGGNLDFYFTGRSFLHKQIRIMVGTLIDIARGRFECISEILAAKNRGCAGQTAPGYGLFLKNVDY